MRRRQFGGILARHIVAVSNGGDVGSVDGERAFEYIACSIERGLVGDDKNAVDFSPSGHADVEASAGGGRRGEGEAAVGGGALRAVLGGGVGEFNELACVRGGQGDRSVSFEAGDGDVAVRVGGGDDPAFPIADVVASGSVEAAVVVASGNDVADHRPLVADRDDGVGVELTGGRSLPLDALVDNGDVVVAGGRDGEGLATPVAVEPAVGDGVEMLVDAPWADAVNRFVDVE